MNEKQVIGQAWNDLLKTFDQREMKRTLKDAYRRTGKMIAAVRSAAWRAAASPTPVSWPGA